jgi:hypothetical protein
MIVNSPNFEHIQEDLEGYDAQILNKLIVGNKNSRGIIPDAKSNVISEGNTSATYNLLLKNIDGVTLFGVRDDGHLYQADISYSRLGQTKPTTPVEGDHFYSKTVHKPVWYNGTAWIDGAGTVISNP